jgi:predicted SAM-dependent methyltransferase
MLFSPRMSWLRRLFTRSADGAPIQLHVGSGPLVRPGWINIDNRRYPGVNRVLDVTRGLPFENVSHIYAEHFIEHLSYEAATKFLRACRRVLRPDGILRLSTPNLDWVWHTQYHPREWQGVGEAVRDCFWMNKAFRGWGHQFLYNVQTLTECLHDAGFDAVVPERYGESRHDELRGIERHEQYPDAHLPHIVIVEAGGTRRAKSELLPGPEKDFKDAVSVV